MVLSLKQARLIKEKTQENMANMLKIHVQTYRKLEENPEEVTIKQAKQIAAYLGLEYNEIFFTN